MTPERQVQEPLEPPSPAERRAFRLLPLVWVVVLVLAGIILYNVFR
jgi:peptidoglycan/LPS O-acetylase OafA/YrhL